MINEQLANQRNISPQAREEINLLHEMRTAVHNLLSEGQIVPSRTVAIKLQEIEIHLQQLWGFPENIAMYKFWWVPTCVCPKHDNDDVHPSGYYTRNLGCPLHGGNNRGAPIA